MFLIETDKVEEENLMEIVLEAGAEDIKSEDETYEVVCPPEAYSDVLNALEAAEIPRVSQSVTRIPQNTVDLNADEARQVLKLIEALDDHDDVQNVSANFNIDESVMAEIAE